MCAAMISRVQRSPTSGVRSLGWVHPVCLICLRCSKRITSGTPASARRRPRQSGQWRTTTAGAGNELRTAHPVCVRSSESSHGADLGLRKLGDPEGLGEFLEPAVADAQQVGGRHHRDQGLLRPPPAFEKPVREVTALAQLGDGEFDRSRPGVPLARAVAVAVVTRSLLTYPCSALQRASASADMSASANVMTTARSRSDSPRRGRPRRGRAGADCLVRSSC